MALLNIRFVPASALPEVNPSAACLGAIVYAPELSSAPDFQAPIAQLHMLGVGDNVVNQNHEGAIAELWTTDTEVTVENTTDCKLAMSADFAFATVSYTDNGDDLAEQTQARYRDLFNTLHSRGYPQTVRVWNYLSGINNNDPSGLERYRGFCLGRAKAFADFFSQSEQHMPAATGIGSLSGPVTLIAIAARAGHDARNIENPEQVPAYRYPNAYGPRPPSFARATCLNPATPEQQIFISGTAAVVGSETVYAGDIQRQLDVTLHNLSTLIGDANLQKHDCASVGGLGDLMAIKVYFRHPQHLSLIRKVCENAFPGRTDIIYLKSEICRQDLDVEIEAVVGMNKNH